ncbi:MAG TPA: globin family protein [Roseiflexaceae bacterium]|nr:globin family protein [Roseiflexaceae bacterium]
MTPEQIALVQTSFAQVLPIAEAAGTLFYGRLFELDPSLKPLFTGDIQEQARKLMTMLKVVVNGLHRIDQLVPAVQELGRRHARYGVKDDYYDTVGAALLWTLRVGLGDSYTPEVAAAWATAYALLAETMKAAAAEALPLAA